MAITKVSNSGFKSGMTKYDSFLAGNEAYDPAATFLIQRVTATGGETSITFSSIPQTYKHLQIRAFAKDTQTGTNLAGDLIINFNGDTASNYVYHYLNGNGTTAAAGWSGGASGAINLYRADVRSYTGLTNIYGAAIVDIHDYTSTTKNKTIRSFHGTDINAANSSYYIVLQSGLWLSTSAITSITVAPQTSLVAGSTFALYGMVG